MQFGFIQLSCSKSHSQSLGTQPHTIGIRYRVLFLKVHLLQLPLNHIPGINLLITSCLMPLSGPLISVQYIQYEVQSSVLFSYKDTHQEHIFEEEGFFRISKLNYFEITSQLCGSQCMSIATCDYIIATVSVCNS